MKVKCEKCGKEISKGEAAEYDGLCCDCFTKMDEECWLAEARQAADEAYAEAYMAQFDDDYNPYY